MMREQFMAVLASRMRQRPISDRQRQWFELGLQFLMTEEFADEQKVVIV